MISIASTLRLLTVGAVLGGTLLAAGCGSPEPATRTTTTERITTAQPPPVTQTTTTTTDQIRQSH